MMFFVHRKIQKPQGLEGEEGVEEEEHRFVIQCHRLEGWDRTPHCGQETELEEELNQDEEGEGEEDQLHHRRHHPLVPHPKSLVWDNDLRVTVTIQSRRLWEDPLQLGEEMEQEEDHVMKTKTADRALEILNYLQHV
ncbi:hypothetical protein BLNAU_1866 [Blattamonas nauphoetae]|uniref:Uncharacterized protein n=1 Tax=Blattamonas nauphoetae TaxID=2049346 RepID=A0ABQ9YHU9_9EUKA|nr:hypothetical protein BLNAU_1866 [Blattamonas nauphoetae]